MHRSLNRLGGFHVTDSLLHWRDERSTSDNHITLLDWFNQYCEALGQDKSFGTLVISTLVVIFEVCGFASYGSLLRGLVRRLFLLSRCILASITSVILSALNLPKNSDFRWIYKEERACLLLVLISYSVGWSDQLFICSAVNFATDFSDFVCAQPFLMTPRAF